jgi:hypothetical protein
MPFGPQTHNFCRVELVQLRVPLGTFMWDYAQSYFGVADLARDITPEAFANLYLEAVIHWFDTTDNDLPGIPSIHAAIWSHALPADPP